MITEGMSISVTDMVTEENTAAVLGSGSLQVYGTPAMLLLIERAAVTMLEGSLEENMTSVGTLLEIEHIAPSPVGSKIVCQLTLREIDRRQLTFDVEVRDDVELIGRGVHKRFLVQALRFQAKADSKKKI